MSNILKYSNKSEMVGFNPIAPAPEGIHNALCIGVFDIGKQFNERFNVTRHRAILMFEVEPTIETEGDLNGKRYVVSKEVTLSLHENAALRKFLKAWSVPLTENTVDVEIERNGEKKTVSTTEVEFDIESLVGKPAMIQLEHAHSADGAKTFVNIINVSPLHESIKPLEIENADFQAPEWVLKKAAAQVNKETTTQKEIK